MAAPPYYFGVTVPRRHPAPPPNANQLAEWAQEKERLRLESPGVPDHELRHSQPWIRAEFKWRQRHTLLPDQQPIIE